MMRAVLIAAFLAVAVPGFAQQVRVISGDIEHVYGPGGELLDNADLQARKSARLGAHADGKTTRD